MRPAIFIAISKADAVQRTTSDGFLTLGRWSAALLVFAIMGLAGSTAWASFPVVTHHQPLGALRGTEAKITFRGDRLQDAHQVLCDLPGIEIVSVVPVDAKAVEVTFRTDENLTPGLYPVRLVTKRGVSNLRFIGVGALPVVLESEPNNAFDSPQSISINHTIDGNVDREDVDYYQLDLKAGQKCTIEIEGIRLGYDLQNRNILDPAIAILDENRFEVASSDDSSLLRQDGVCSFTPEADGRYIISVRESSFLGQKDVCGYRLHVGTFPRPIAVLPSGGTKGQALEATLIDIDGSTSSVTVDLPSEPVDMWPVVRETDQGIAPSPNWIHVGDAPLVLEVEPNDNYQAGQTVAVPALLCGVIEKPNDFDCFSFDGKKGQSFRFQVHARERMRSPLDGVLNVFGPDHKAIKSSDDIGFNRDGFVDITLPTDGQHTIRIYDHLRSGSPLHHYVISVTPIVPSVSLDLKEVRRDEAVVVPVPAGGYGAMMVQATRSGFNDPMGLELLDLPPGVTAVTFPLPAGRPEVPVLLKAEPDAVLGGTLFDVHATGKRGETVVTADLRQHHKLVLGQNRREMFGYDTTRAAMAVVEPMPFDIEIVQPKTPVLRRGSKELLVKLTRHEGFDDRVFLKTLYNPPGIGVNNSKRIEKDQTEVSVPITANGNAGLGEWPMILQVSYGTPAGTQTVATGAIMLNVEDAVFNFEFPRIAAEQGTQTSLTVGMTKKREIDGEIDVTLVGLPNGVTCPEPTQKVSLSDTAVTFPIVVDANAKTGAHKTLVVQTRIVRDAETMTQTDGNGEIRVDAPLPVKQAEAAPEPAKPAAPAQPAAPKPLSRLEQLRQMKGDS